MHPVRSLLFTFIALGLFLPLGSIAQEGSFSCGTDMVHKHLKENAPKGKEQIEALEKELEEQRKNFVDRAGQVYIIPVVFHIIHDNGPENLSNDVIEEAVEQLNLDYRKENFDTNDIESPFDDLAADAEIEFRLAQKDPQGNCHLGINRIQDDLTYDGSFNSGIKSLIQWDPSMYMNVWICNNIGGGVAGYALKPPGANWNPSKDGIVVEYSYVGTGDRTLTHEAGHYLNLDHTWGTGQVGDSGNCTDDDGLGDTPNTIGWQHCGNPSGSSCSSQDNVQNYMEYSFCHRMFTPNQANAMRSALNSSVADRNQLWQSSNLQATGTDGNDVLCVADLEADQRMVCAGEPLQFYDRSYHGATSWNWDFHGGNANDPNAEDPVVTYNNTGIYDVSLTASNSGGSVDTTLKDYIKVVPKPGFPLPLIEHFDWIDPPISEHEKYLIKDLGSDGVTWEWTDQAGEGGSRGSIMLDNFNNDAGQVDLFETTSLDASNLSTGDLRLSFDVAYAKVNSGDGDELIIHASDNCGVNWSQRGSFNANDLETAPATSDPFVPGDEEWTNHIISTSIAVYNVEDLRFRFEFISDGGNNIYIDNINVHDQNNVGIEENREQETSFTLHPNPVEEKAWVELDLPSSERVSIELRDILGKKVKEWEQGELTKGMHRMKFGMEELEAGPYFLILHAGEERMTRKLFKR